MTPDDPIVRLFVERSLIARIATHSAKGWPALTPLWFIEHGGHLYATTGAGTLAASNAARDPAAAVLLDAEAGGASAHILRLYGRATVHRGLPSWRILASFARKYYLSPAGMRCEWANRSRWDLRRRYYAQSEPVVIEIVPERAELMRRPSIDASAHATSRS